MMDGLDQSGNVNDPVAWLNAHPEAPRWLREVVTTLPKLHDMSLNSPGTKLYVDGEPVTVLVEAANRTYVIAGHHDYRVVSTDCLRGVPNGRS